MHVCMNNHLHEEPFRSYRVCCGEGEQAAGDKQTERKQTADKEHCEETLLVHQSVVQRHLRGRRGGGVKLFELVLEEKKV